LPQKFSLFEGKGLPPDVDRSHPYFSLPLKGTGFKVKMVRSHKGGNKRLNQGK
jgi:hypothetical protein